jgi:hypothetical protein
LVGDTNSKWDVKKYSDVLKKKAAIQQMYKDMNFMDGRVNVERLYPPDIPELPDLLTMDKKKLKVGLEAGGLAVSKAFETLSKSS